MTGEGLRDLSGTRTERPISAVVRKSVTRATLMVFSLCTIIDTLFNKR